LSSVQLKTNVLVYELTLVNIYSQNYYKTDSNKVYLILEINNDVQHDKCLGRQYVLGAFGAFLQPRLKRLVSPTYRYITANAC